MLVEVYTDGSSDGKSGNKCSWAFVVCVDGVKVAEGSGSLPVGTNNVAEVVAAVRGLDYVATTDIPGYCDMDDVHSDKQDDGGAHAQVVLISDSQLALRWGTGEYRCKKWHLIPNVIQLRKLVQRLGAETRWVKGHSGNEHNETCDRLAKSARESADNPQQQSKAQGCP
jgi:ribonuclease HI